MHFTLRKIVALRVQWNVTVKLVYIPSKQNVIADALSRETWNEAKVQINELGWQFNSCSVFQMRQWEDELVSLNKKHRFLDYFVSETPGVDSAIK